MAWELRVGGVNVNRLDKAGESDQQNTQQRERRNAYIEAIFGQMTVLAFDLTVARVHAAVSAELDRTGRQVGAHDLIIAATAIAHDYRVATRDLKSFPKIPGLETVRI